jgi:hypothetical protein
MGNSEKQGRRHRARFWQGLDDQRINRPSTFMAMGWRHRGSDSAAAPALPKNQPETAKLAA